MKYCDHENLYVYSMKENDENASNNSGMFHFYSRLHEYHPAAGTVNSGTACTSSVVQTRYRITIYIRVCIHSNKFKMQYIFATVYRWPVYCLWCS